MPLEIESALRALLARSGDCVWRGDKDNYAQCWATDGEWHILGEVTRGRKAVADRWAELMAPFLKVWHIAHSPLFGFDRDLPAARVYLEETMVAADGSVSLLKGVYHDTFIHEDGAWRYRSRHIDIGYLGAADYSGRWFPMIDHGPGPYDPDPSRASTPSMSAAYGAPE